MCTDFIYFPSAHMVRVRTKFSHIRFLRMACARGTLLPAKRDELLLLEFRQSQKDVPFSVQLLAYVFHRGAPAPPARQAPDRTSVHVQSKGRPGDSQWRL